MTRTRTAPTATRPNGEMSVREAGKKGGNAVRERYGNGFYEQIGRKGGQVTRERHGQKLLRNDRPKRRSSRQGQVWSRFYEEIGHKGGQKVKELIEQAKKALKESQ